MKEPRSHIEGATPSTAIWSYGIVPDPFTPPGRPAGSSTAAFRSKTSCPPTRSSGMLDRVYDLTAQIETPTSVPRRSPTCRATKVAEIDAAIARNQAELDRVTTEYDSLSKRADDLEAQADAGRGRRRCATRPRRSGDRPPRCRRSRSRSR